MVPVGLSRFRDGLYPLEPFTREDAKEVLETIHKWQKKVYEEYGYHFIHAGDEWYILAGYEMPEEERYDGYLQLENGVGMIRLLQNEFAESYEKLEPTDREISLSMATGYLAYDYLAEFIKQMRVKCPNCYVHLYRIRNDFFGESITVSGLITGQDLISQLQGRPLGDCLLLPCNMLRSGEEVFLDDVTVSELEEALQVKVDIVKSSGQDFIDAVLKER